MHMFKSVVAYLYKDTAVVLNKKHIKGANAKDFN